MYENQSEFDVGDFTFAVLEVHIKYGYGNIKIYESTFFNAYSDDVAIMTLSEYYEEIKKYREEHKDDE